MVTRAWPRSLIEQTRSKQTCNREHACVCVGAVGKTYTKTYASILYMCVHRNVFTCWSFRQRAMIGLRSLPHALRQACANYFIELFGPPLPRRIVQMMNSNLLESH